MSLNLCWSLKPWPGSQRQSSMGGSPVGKNITKITFCLRQGPAEATGAGEGTNSGFPDFSFQLSQVGSSQRYLFDHDNDDIVIKSRVISSHFADGDP